MEEEKKDKIEWIEKTNFSFGSPANKKKKDTKDIEEKIEENQGRGRHSSIYGEVDEKKAEQIINQLIAEEEKKIQKQGSQSFSK